MFQIHRPGEPTRTLTRGRKKTQLRSQERPRSILAAMIGPSEKT